MLKKLRNFLSIRKQEQKGKKEVGKPSEKLEAIVSTVDDVNFSAGWTRIEQGVGRTTREYGRSEISLKHCVPLDKQTLRADCTKGQIGCAKSIIHWYVEFFFFRFARRPLLSASLLSRSLKRLSIEIKRRKRQKRRLILIQDTRKRKESCSICRGWGWKKRQHRTELEYISWRCDPNSLSAFPRGEVPRNEFRKWSVRLLEIPGLFGERVRPSRGLFACSKSTSLEFTGNLWPMGRQQPKYRREPSSSHLRTRYMLLLKASQLEFSVSTVYEVARYLLLRIY